MFSSGTKYFLRLVPHQDEHDDPHEWLPPIDRRAVVRVLGYSAIAGVIGCGSGSVSSSNGSSGSTSTSKTSTTTNLSSSLTSTTTGTSVTLTAVVSPAAATGTVTFYNGTTALGSGTLSSGSASLAASFSAAGTYTLTAVYAGDGTYASSTSATVTVTVSGTTAACSETREGEEGPYFVDDSASGYNRSNILSNLDGSNTQTGVPFVLTLYVMDAKNNCAAMQNVQVDIWHCNAGGVYSAESSESTSSQSWLRGYPLTDANGKVQFTTIIPGWYSGRTTHIHLRLRSSYDATSNSGSNTMQLFFDQTLLDTLDTTVAPYSSEGKNTTTNTSDRVYSTEEGGTTLMTVNGSTSAGFSATADVYLPIVQTY